MAPTAAYARHRVTTGKQAPPTACCSCSRLIARFCLAPIMTPALAYAHRPWRCRPRGPSPPFLHTDQGSEYTARATAPRSSGWASPSRWACRDRRWTTRSSSRGTPPWSSSCGPCISSPPGSAPAAAAASIEDYNYVRRHSRSACAARWITSGRWRERTPRDRGGPAARAGQRGAAPPLSLLRPPGTATSPPQVPRITQSGTAIQPNLTPIIAAPQSRQSPQLACISIHRGHARPCAEMRAHAASRADACLLGEQLRGSRCQEVVDHLCLMARPASTRGLGAQLPSVAFTSRAWHCHAAVRAGELERGR